MRSRSATASACHRVCVASVKFNGDVRSAYSGSGVKGTLRSSLLDIELFSPGNGTAQTVQSVFPAVTLTFQMRPLQYNQTLTCRSINPTALSGSSSWNADFTSQYTYNFNGLTYVSCSFSHLTSFGVFEGCPSGYYDEACSLVDIMDKIARITMHAAATVLQTILRERATVPARELVDLL